MSDLPKTLSAYLKELGKRGGTARALALTPARRSAIAKKAVQARERKRKLASTNK